MKPGPEEVILAALRKWLKCGIPWAHHDVLREIVGLPEKTFAPTLRRLVERGLIVHEGRVGVRVGAYKAMEPTRVGSGL